MLDFEPLTDSSICSPHSEHNPADLQSATNSHSLSFCHKLVPEIMQDRTHKHTGWSLHRSRVFVSYILLKGNASVLMHTDSDKYIVGNGDIDSPEEAMHISSFVLVFLTETK